MSPRRRSLNRGDRQKTKFERDSSGENCIREYHEYLDLKRYDDTAKVKAIISQVAFQVH